jgi:hypothetical protein
MQAQQCGQPRARAFELAQGVSTSTKSSVQKVALHHPRCRTTEPRISPSNCHSVVPRTRACIILHWQVNIAAYFKTWDCQKLLPESLALSPQMTSSLVGALMGTLAAGPMADFLGRKTVLMIAGYIFLGCGALLGWSPNIAVLVAGRALLGVAIGLQSTTLPLYIAECAPAWIRGSLNVMPQVSWLSGKTKLAG